MNKSELKDLMAKININRDEIAFSNLFDFLPLKLKPLITKRSYFRKCRRAYTRSYEYNLVKI